LQRALERIDQAGGHAGGCFGQEVGEHNVEVLGGDPAQPYGLGHSSALTIEAAAHRCEVRLVSHRAGLRAGAREQQLAKLLRVLIASYQRADVLA
jgi:hypothetical protein